MPIILSGSTGIVTPSAKVEDLVTGKIVTTGDSGELQNSFGTISPPFNITATSGFANLEMGGPSGAYIDMKSPADSDYDARIIYQPGNSLSITTNSTSSDPILLRHGNSTKLSTTSTGIDVTGAITTDGLTVDGAALVQAGNGATATLSLNNADGNGTMSQLNLGYTADPDHGNIKYTGDMIFHTGGNNERMQLDGSGHLLLTPASQGNAFVPNTSSTWNALEIFQDRGVTNSASGIAFRSQSGTAPAGIVSVAGNTTGGIEDLAFMTASGNQTFERMRIASDGVVTKPYQPAFAAAGTGSTWTSYLAADTYHKVAFTSEDFDIGGNYNNSTYDFTAPVTGKYLFLFTMYAQHGGGQDDDNHYWSARFGLNGGVISQPHIIKGYTNQGDNDTTAPMSSLLSVSANDTIQVYIRGHSGATVRYYGPGCYFSGYLVG